MVPNPSSPPDPPLLPVVTWKGANPMERASEALNLIPSRSGNEEGGGGGGDFNCYVNSDCPDINQD